MDITPGLRYRDEDRELLSVEMLSRRARVSQAFIRLCISLGCPTDDQRLSQEMLLQWLFENYEFVRRRAGLSEMLPIDGVPPEACRRLKMGNAVITLLEYSESRSSNLGEKERLQRVQQMIYGAMDRC